MQDRYAGDVGDFGKFGLLRALCGTDFRLGVLWYRNDRDPPGEDGRHIGYLDKIEEYGNCDAPLFELMRKVVGEKRSIDIIESIGVLPETTEYHSTRFEETGRRNSWIADGLKKVAGCDLVFADPDNGLEVGSVLSDDPEAVKYAFYADLVPVWKRGQSLIVYQHGNRNKLVERQIEERLRALRKRFCNPPPCFIALRYRRGTARMFFILAQPKHRDRIANRCRNFMASPWGRKGHFTWPDAMRGTAIETCAASGQDRARQGGTV